MTVYEVTLQLLSPVHIGDGDELRQGFDFTIRDGRTYRLNEDAVLLAKADRLQRRRDGSYPLPGELLSDGDYSNPALFRYVLRGQPRSQKADARLRPFIKDVYDRPYIPGSSLKGALRTALAWTGWPEVKPILERSTIGRNRSWAGQPLERKLFGPDPNHDLLRALHVADLSGPQRPGEGLMVVNAQVLSLRSSSAPVEMEALAGDLSFKGSITVDETLFTPWAEGALHFQNRKHWLDELGKRAQAHSKARLARLLAWFERAEGGQKIAGFYRELNAVQLPPNRALVQIGWGSGWDGKTFWTHLQKDAQLFEQLVSEFRLNKAGSKGPRRQSGDPFPRSRRVAVSVKNGVAQPVAPFGWALLELKKV